MKFHPFGELKMTVLIDLYTVYNLNSIIGHVHFSFVLSRDFAKVNNFPNNFFYNFWKC